MKSKKTKDQTAGAAPKGKVKIKSLKLSKESIQDLSDRDAGNVKGGSSATKGGGGGGSTIMAQCWVARAVYGEDNPRWLLFREWLLDDAPGWFRRLYIRHGERFARWISPHLFVKTVIRRWMDARIDRTQSVHITPI